MFDYSEIQDAEIYKKDGKWYSDNSFVNAVIGIESAHNSMAYNKSGAKGLFQFVPSTARQYGLDNPFSPEQSLKAFKKLTADNIRQLLKFNIPVTPVNIYLAHQQGANGFRKAYNHMKNNSPISDTLLRNIKNNSLGGFKSLIQWYEDWQSRIERGMQS